MPLVIYNTMTGRKEPFAPLEEGRVKIYVCGPTVYDDSHIGHARAVVVFDILVRHLKSMGLEVTYVRNFTDLDDKIIQRSQEQGVDYLDLAERYIQSFHEDMDALGNLRPAMEPRATEHIKEMIADIQALMAKGCAYQAGGDVYYEVASFPAYGRLSGRNPEDLKAGARIEIDERKRSPLDFALWKESKPGEPKWSSPWGQGRPGWHLECSVMCNQYLGPEFDIHGGGHDLVFPHHENEIAQAAPLGRKFARLWMHNGFVRINKQKMSKSLKNFFTVKEILGRFHPEVLRLFLLSTHYRGPLDFSDEALEETGRGLDRAYRALLEAGRLGPGSDETAPDSGMSGLRSRFRAAMDDDLNTARAIGHIFEGVRELNRLLGQAKTNTPNIEKIKAWAGTITDMGRVLGILGLDPAEYFSPKQDAALAGAGLTSGMIEDLVQARSEARARKDWTEADRIRDELKTQGVVLEDSGGQTQWRVEA